MAFTLNCASVTAISATDAERKGSQCRPQGLTQSNCESKARRKGRSLEQRSRQLSTLVCGSNRRLFSSLWRIWWMHSLSKMSHAAPFCSEAAILLQMPETVNVQQSFRSYQERATLQNHRKTDETSHKTLRKAWWHRNTSMRFQQLLVQGVDAALSSVRDCANTGKLNFFVLWLTRLLEYHGEWPGNDTVNSLRTLGCILSGPIDLWMLRFLRWSQTWFSLRHVAPSATFYSPFTPQLWGREAAREGWGKKFSEHLSLLLILVTSLIALLIRE